VIKLRVETHTLLVYIVGKNIHKLIVVDIFQICECYLFAVVRVNPAWQKIKHNISDLIRWDDDIVCME